MSAIAASYYGEPNGWIELVQGLGSADDPAVSWEPANGIRLAVVQGSGADVCISSDGSAILHGYASLGDLSALCETPEAEITNPCDALLECVKRYSHSILARISGGYVLVDWDITERTLTVSRDWHGMLPIFATRHADGWILATRTKHLLAMKSFVAAPNRGAIQLYQYNGWSPRGQSLLHGVIHCEPGTTTSFNGHRVKATPYKLPPSVPIPASLPAAADQIRDSLRSKVADHLPEGKRIGMAVSGGVDSVYMTALVKEALQDRKLMTFSYGYGPDDPNIRGGAQISEFLGCEHLPVFTEPEELPELLRRSILHLEEPVGRDQYPMLYKMAQIAGSQVDVLVTGNCGGGIFGTSPHAKHYRMAERWSTLRSALEDLATEDYSGAAPRSALGHALLFWKRLRSGTGTPSAARVVGAAAGDDRIHFPITSPPLLSALKEEVETSLGQQAIKALMLDGASSLDIRHPYSDISLLSLALSIPDQWRLSRGHSKIALRVAAEASVPLNLAWAPKGISRLRHDDRLWDVIEILLKEKVSDGRVAQRGLLEPESVRALTQLPDRSRRTMRWLYRLWYLIALEIWCEIFLDNRGRLIGLRRPGGGWNPS